mgnify:CR=1 FL=1
MTQTFADSFYFLALFNPRDSAHEKAVDASRTISGLLVTTDWVLAEVADALSDVKNRSACASFINDLRRSPNVEIIPGSRQTFDAGWALYQQRPDKDCSLTDCISFAIMESRGIREALTGDHDFTQAGFQATLV